VNLAQSEAFSAMRAARSDARIGTAFSMSPCEPAGDAEADAAATERWHAFVNLWYLETALAGRYPDAFVDGPPLERMGVRDGDLERLRAPLDFLGINLYTRTLVQHQRVRLEDLVAAPQQVLHNLLRALGLTSSPEIIDHMLRYHESPKPYYHSTIERPDNALEGENMAKHRTFQVNQPLFSSTSRWKKEIPQSQWPGLTESLQPWLKSHGYAEEMA
jgi:hypothetical protein